VKLDKPAEFVGRRALRREHAAGGPPRRLVGLTVDWTGVEAMHAAQGLPPVVPAAAWRTAVPVYSPVRQVGRATSGTWSPTLKRNIALASVDAAVATPGTRLEIEWTVEARRGRVAATVVDLPFLDLPRKRE
jgi:aminomethyltransferase